MYPPVVKYNIFEIICQGITYVINSLEDFDIGGYIFGGDIHMSLWSVILALLIFDILLDIIAPDSIDFE